MHFWWRINIWPYIVTIRWKIFSGKINFPSFQLCFRDFHHIIWMGNLGGHLFYLAQRSTILQVELFSITAVWCNLIFTEPLSCDNHKLTFSILDRKFCWKESLTYNTVQKIRSRIIYLDFIVNLNRCAASLFMNAIGNWNAEIFIAWIYELNR